MAEAEKKKDGDSEDEVAAPPKKSKRKLIIFVVIGIVVLAIAGAGAFFLMKKKPGAEGADGAVAETEAPEKIKKNDLPPVYLKLDPFTTNLAMESAEQASAAAGQYIQVVVEMKVEDAKAEEELKQYMPEIRNNILRLLSSKAPSKLASTEGKDLLASEIRDSVNGIADPDAKKGAKPPSGPVESVLFSSFIIQ